MESSTSSADWHYIGAELSSKATQTAQLAAEAAASSANTLPAPVISSSQPITSSSSWLIGGATVAGALIGGAAVAAVTSWQSRRAGSAGDDSSSGCHHGVVESKMHEGASTPAAAPKQPQPATSATDGSNFDFYVKSGSGEPVTCSSKKTSAPKEPPASLGASLEQLWQSQALPPQPPSKKALPVLPHGSPEHQPQAWLTSTELLRSKEFMYGLGAMTIATAAFGGARHLYRIRCHLKQSLMPVALARSAPGVPCRSTAAMLLQRHGTVAEVARQGELALVETSSISPILPQACLRHFSAWRQHAQDLDFIQKVADEQALEAVEEEKWTDALCAWSGGSLADATQAMSKEQSAQSRISQAANDIAQQVVEEAMVNSITTARLKNMEKESKMNRQKLHAARVQVSSLVGQLSNTQKELEAAKMEVEAQQNANSSETTKASDKEQLNAERESELVATREELARELVVAKEQTRQLKWAKQELEEEMESTQRELQEELEATKKELQWTKQELEEEMKSTQREREEELEATKKDLNWTKQELEEEMKSTQREREEELEATKKELEELEAAKKELEATKQDLDATKRELKDRSESVKQLRNYLRSEGEALQASRNEADTNRTSVSELKGKLEHVSLQLKQTLSDVEELKRNLSNTRARLQASLRSEEEANMALAYMATELEDNKRTLEAAVGTPNAKQTEREVEELTERLADAQKRLQASLCSEAEAKSALSHMATNMKERLSNAEKRLQVSSYSANQSIQMAKHSANQSEREVEELKEKLADAQKRLRASLCSEEKTKTALSHMATRMKERLLNAEKRLEASEATHSANQSEREVEELRERLSDAETRLQASLCSEEETKRTLANVQSELRDMKRKTEDATFMGAAMGSLKKSVFTTKWTYELAQTERLLRKATADKDAAEEQLKRNAEVDKANLESLTKQLEAADSNLNNDIIAESEVRRLQSKEAELEAMSKDLAATKDELEETRRKLAAAEEKPREEELGDQQHDSSVVGSPSGARVVRWTRSKEDA